MFGRTVVGASGRAWRVRRRWLPWQPRKRGKLSDAGEALDGIDLGLDLADGPWGILAAILAVIALLLFIVFVLPIIITVLEVLVVLVLLPLFVVARFVLRKPWIIVAHTEGPPAEDRVLSVSGWRKSREAMDKLVDDIQIGG